jgi:hypothetical protein
MQPGYSTSSITSATPMVTALSRHGAGHTCAHRLPGTSAHTCCSTLSPTLVHGSEPWWVATDPSAYPTPTYPHTLPTGRAVGD